ncbi:MAG TPA: Asp-tRNA(Asn)/Glu-tRNA(Gln) amidotransferase subunit GatC [Candidatus Scybalocola faecigallinarum]|uniref:Aspartyl/glutamyl-tRNA(Asn/Gln) amidotransferase subunit C n=1 Tax=Candidatus Scybalocola faecigallinarum TaxID=2840941 RepID=A0A9D1JR46_9FIRM|nr:Asp-tRNA(Asn)/Glu-tRNA(Gln) amidotransferase subunit GatC [Candidatus Scybalocola faecigallinarum]
MSKIVINDAVMDNVEILAKLSLSNEERVRAMEKMQEILDYMEKLNELDTENVEPLVNLYERGNVFREDQVQDNDIKEMIVEGAPRKKDGQYMVPKTI